MDWRTRYHEWKALLGYCRERRQELEAKGRTAALVRCLQRHWQDCCKLKQAEI